MPANPGNTGGELKSFHMNHLVNIGFLLFGIGGFLLVGLGCFLFGFYFGLLFAVCFGFNFVLAQH